MAKRRSLEDKLAELGALCVDPTSGEAAQALRRALADRDNYLVARAAQIVGQFEIDQLEPDLVQAFGRFMVDPLKTDKGCAARAAVAEALYRISAHREDVFLQGIRCVQLEPVYGGREDTAARLRGLCALGLVRMNYGEVMVELARLLADPVTDARIAAARAIGYARQDGGVPLLWFKALVGDEDPQVLYECFTALLGLDAALSLPFIVDFLQNGDVAIAEAAALALGESRLEEAFDILKAAWERTLDPGLRRAELLAIATLRHEQALKFLLSQVTEGTLAGAREALAALELYRDDDRVWRRVQRCVDRRDDL